jgi:hypothetical protein
MTGTHRSHADVPQQSSTALHVYHQASEDTLIPREGTTATQQRGMSLALRTTQLP